jgi:hypothetical protein
MARVRVPKGLENWQAAAEQAGWQLVQTKGNGHIRWCPPDGQFILTGSGHGPSADPRTIRNITAALRRAGLTVEDSRRPSGRKVR